MGASRVLKPRSYFISTRGLTLRQRRRRSSSRSAFGKAEDDYLLAEAAIPVHKSRRTLITSKELDLNAMKKKIALVTEEIAGFGQSGGIGAAFFELAVVLAKAGCEVDLFYFPVQELDQTQRAQAVEIFLDLNVRVIFIDPTKYVFDVGSARNRSYSVYRALKERLTTYDYIHFHDYKGLGYFCTSAKQQNLAFKNTELVVQLHGPLRWTLEANRSLFTHVDQVVIDFLERRSIEQADHVVSPSHYLVDWLKAHQFRTPTDDRVHVIKNVCNQAASQGVGSREGQEHVEVTEIIFFGRHEARKGLVLFCDALDLVEPTLSRFNVSVTFLGGLGEVNGVSSGVYLSDRALKWSFNLKALVDLKRNEAISYLASRPSALVVMPSSSENSPYTVVEAVAVGRPVLASRTGGGKELIHQDFHDEAVVDPEPEALAARLGESVRSGARVPRLAERPEDIVEQWLHFHNKQTAARSDTLGAASNPKVVIGITHYERPRKLIGAILSALRQTYSNIEVVVVDDGSQSEETIEALAEIEKMLISAGGRLIRRNNGYLGAARNTIARETDSDYLLFLDDDDLLFPNAVEKLVDVASHTRADIVNCLNIYMDAADRPKYEFAPESMPAKIAYVPLGGPLSIAHLSNVFGAATALLNRSFFDKIGGYTEIKRVGYEDYELYLRAAQDGARIQILPEPLYLYEVNKPSMVSGTSRFANKARVVDAINLMSRPFEWHDAMALAAGQECVTDEANYKNWRNSVSPFREELEAVDRSRYDLSLHLTALANYAARVGSPAAAMWEGAHPDVRKQVSRHGLKDVAPTVSSTFGTRDVSALLSVISSWGEGAPDTAAAKIADQMKTSGNADRSMVDLVYLIAGSSALSPGSAAVAVEALEGTTTTDSEALALLGATVVLEFAAGNMQRAKSKFDQLFVLESETYVNDYPDLVQALHVPARQGWRHYRKFGENEGRRGFVVLRRVVDTLHRRTGHPIDFRGLPESAHQVFNTTAGKPNILGSAKRILSGSRRNKA